MIGLGDGSRDWSWGANRNIFDVRLVAYSFQIDGSEEPYRLGLTCCTRCEGCTSNGSERIFDSLRTKSTGRFGVL